jgi:hypothetical protein
VRQRIDDLYFEAGPQLDERTRERLRHAHVRRPVVNGEDKDTALLAV